MTMFGSFKESMFDSLKELSVICYTDSGVRYLSEWVPRTKIKCFRFGKYKEKKDMQPPSKDLKNINVTSKLPDSSQRSRDDEQLLWQSIVSTGSTVQKVALFYNDRKELDIETSILLLQKTLRNQKRRSKLTCISRVDYWNDANLSDIEELDQFVQKQSRFHFNTRTTVIAIALTLVLCPIVWRYHCVLQLHSLFGDERNLAS